jgi:ribosomal protein S18 acetylase RimI-like enzyme
VERKRSFAELEPEDLERIINIWNPTLAHQNMKERFDRGASLWLIKFEDRLAGYGWTLQGRTIAPYYFPLAEDDVQFFDFHVFPKFRGRAIDWFLMTEVLQRVTVDGAARAFAEAAEWNQASLSSLTTTSFRRLGMARKLTIFRHTIVCWADDETIQQERTASRERSSTPTPAEKVRSSTLNSGIF